MFLFLNKKIDRVVNCKRLFIIWGYLGVFIPGGINKEYAAAFIEDLLKVYAVVFVTGMEEDNDIPQCLIDEVKRRMTMRIKILMNYCIPSQTGLRPSPDPGGNQSTVANL